MKNLNTIINIVLGIAVVTLFVLHFKGNSTSSIDAIDINDTTKVAVVKPKITNNTLLKDAKVVYVNADSISKLCLYYKESEKLIDSKRKKIDAILDGQVKSLDAEYMGYQQRGATMTQDELQQAQQSIQMKKQKLEQDEIQLKQSFQKDVMTLNKSIEGKITKFMDQYAKIKGYRFILTYGGGSNLLYANDSLDVSFEVINGLNNQYKAKK